METIGSIPSMNILKVIIDKMRKLKKINAVLIKCKSLFLLLDCEVKTMANKLRKMLDVKA